MNVIKLMVFDLDGVLVNSEPLHRRAKEIILNDYGVEDTINLDETVGLPNEAFWADIIRKNKLLVTPDEMVMLQNNLILTAMANTKIVLNSGLLMLLNELERRGIKIGLASSSNRYYVNKVLDILGIKDRFIFTVAGDEVFVRKPSPECYLKAMALAGSKPSEAAAIEDSAAGVRAAVSAGMTCFGYRNPTSGNQDLSLANITVNSLEQIIPFLK